MKILYLNKTPAHGGAEEAMLSYVLAARDLGHSVVVAVPSPGWLTHKADDAGIPCHLFPRMPAYAPSVWGQSRWWLHNAVTIAHYVRSRGIDVVHANTPRVGYHAGLAARLGGAASIVHVHDTCDLPYRQPLKRNLLHRLSDMTVTVSDSVRDTIVSTGFPEHAVRRIYNGLDLERYARVRPIDIRRMLGWSASTRIVGSVSTMIPMKGQDVLLKAFIKLANRDSDLRLVIVGGAGRWPESRRHEARLHEIAHQSGVAERVHFSGWREDALSWIKAFDLFCHVPTQPDSLPTVVLHACALATPVVASRTGGIPEIIRDRVSGRLVEPGATSDLAAVLTESLEKPDNLNDMRQAAREHCARTFDRKTMADGLARLYDDIDAQRMLKRGLRYRTSGAYRGTRGAAG